MDKLCTISEAAKYYGVSSSTLRRWERQGKLIPERTHGKQRRYRLSKESTNINIKLGERMTIAYARVSSNDQKSDLARQKQLLEMYCASQGWQFSMIADLGVA